jgi:hypothetical protein
MLIPATKITFTDPDGNGRIAGTFLEVSDQPMTINDPGVVGGTRRVDTAWVRYSEGEREGLTQLVPCFDIRPAG